MNALMRTETLAARYIDEIRAAVVDNQLPEALKKLQDFVRGLAPHLQNTVLVLRRRYKQFLQDDLAGFADPNTVDKITNDILKIASEAEARAAIKPSYALCNSTFGIAKEKIPAGPPP